MEAAHHFDPDQTPEEAFGAYAQVVAENRLLALVNCELKHKRTARLVDLPAPEPDPHIERAAIELWSAAEILDADDRELLAERYGLDGRQRQGLYEICARRDIPMGTLRRRLERIRQAMKLELIERGWRSGGSSPPPVCQAQLNIG